MYKTHINVPNQLLSVEEELVTFIIADLNKKYENKIDTELFNFVIIGAWINKQLDFWQTNLIVEFDVIQTQEYKNIIPLIERLGVGL